MLEPTTFERLTFYRVHHPATKGLCLPGLIFGDLTTYVHTALLTRDLFVVANFLSYFFV